MRAHNTPEVDQDESFEPDIVYISNSEWLAIYEREVKDELGISAAEFVQRFQAGDFEECDPTVSRLSVSIPMYEAIHTV